MVHTGGEPASWTGCPGVGQLVSQQIRQCCCKTRSAGQHQHITHATYSTHTAHTHCTQFYTLAESIWVLTWRLQRILGVITDPKKYIYSDSALLRKFDLAMSNCLFVCPFVCQSVCPSVVTQTSLSVLEFLDKSWLKCFLLLHAV